MDLPFSNVPWDTVFIVKANESEIPLLHEHNGISNENGTSIEEERRLFYVAMTRARKKLLILYVMMDTNWQMLQPSRFVNEIPGHLREVQDEISITGTRTKNPNFPEETTECNSDVQKENKPSEVNSIVKDLFNDQTDGVSKVLTDTEETYNGNSFVRRFNVEERSVVSHLFHQWAKKKAFQDPRRLLDKVRFVIDERLTIKNNKHKNVLRELKSSLSCNEAFHYAEYVLRWEQIPADQRAHLMREKQEHFMKLRIENSMSSTAATTKQVSYLQSLGCTIVPTSRLHASHLIEQYKSL